MTVLSSQCLSPLWGADMYWLIFRVISSDDITNSSGLKFPYVSTITFCNYGNTVVLGPSDSTASCGASNSSL